MRFLFKSRMYRSPLCYRTATAFLLCKGGGWRTGKPHNLGVAEYYTRQPDKKMLHNNLRVVEERPEQKHLLLFLNTSQSSTIATHPSISTTRIFPVIHLLVLHYHAKVLANSDNIKLCILIEQEIIQTILNSHSKIKKFISTS